MHYVVCFNFLPVGHLSTAHVSILFPFSLSPFSSFPFCVTVVQALIRLLSFARLFPLRHRLSPSLVSVRHWMFSHSSRLFCLVRFLTSHCLAHLHIVRHAPLPLYICLLFPSVCTRLDCTPHQSVPRFSLSQKAEYFLVSSQSSFISTVRPYRVLVLLVCSQLPFPSVFCSLV